MRLRVPTVLLVMTTLLAAAAALGAPSREAPPTATALPSALPVPTTSTTPTSTSISTSPPTPTPTANASARAAKPPRSWLPPGATPADGGPSTAIFPPQSLPLRFDHSVHVARLGMRCVSCHLGATSSHAAQDRLLPPPTKCDGCHGTDHRALGRVAPGTGDAAACSFCHEGADGAGTGVVARVVIPPPNLVFDHQKHAARNIGCAQCHGDVGRVGLATRAQLPRMRGCVRCHQHPDSAARGDAKGECTVCHLRGDSKGGGTIRTAFPSGTLSPPRWLHNAEHGPDFLQRHRMVAGDDSRFCASCHSEDFCTACHDGRVRPRNIHPSDYLSMHGVEARLATQRCTSCHRQQSFCLSCHQRLGISEHGPQGVREPGRFHPPKAVWSDPPRRPGHHGPEATRNLSACVSCHGERDCVACHGGQGIGAGFNPHGPGFAASCASAMARNPRPCLVCHDPGAPVLERCR